jgi:peptidoglycan/LPS O-acetylase OafA/YrhL
MLSLWIASLVAPAIGILLIRKGALTVGPYATLLDDVPGNELLARTLAYFPPLRLPEFALGILVGHALRCAPSRPRSTTVDTVRELGLLSALLGCSWVLGTGPIGEFCGIKLADRIVIESGAMAPLFALIVWQLARGHGLLRQLLSGTALVTLGEASYGLYILQEPVVVWSSALLKRLVPNFNIHAGLFFWGYFALLTAVSLLVYLAVERPLRKRIMSRLTPNTSNRAH